MQIFNLDECGVCIDCGFEEGMFNGEDILFAFTVYHNLQV